MATQIYNYTWENSWQTKGTSSNYVNDAALREECETKMNNLVSQKFGEQLAKTGKWFKVTTIKTEVTKLLAEPIFGRPPPKNGEPEPPKILLVNYTLEGKTTMEFQCDAPPNAEFSPQGWEEVLWLILTTIAAVIIAHPLLFLTIIAIIAFAWLVSKLTEAGGFQGIIFGKESGIVGSIGTFIILILLLLLLFGALPTMMSLFKKGKKKKKTKEG